LLIKKNKKFRKKYPKEYFLLPKPKTKFQIKQKEKLWKEP